jgi:hypothetical protein
MIAGGLFWLEVIILVWLWKDLSKRAAGSPNTVNESRKVKENVLAIVKPVGKDAAKREIT